ncbi:MAG: DUF1559 domain-containing protein [Phycisphaeraceae bacterium]|nr:DUF1559 domain-containing protein [Phycisphaeraceae bacterium]
MLPALGSVQETARRVKCASNIRQIGLATASYSSDYLDTLPDSMFLRPEHRNPGQMMTLRLASSDTQGRSTGRRGRRLPYPLPLDPQPWDGLGRLYELDYANAPELFYCPSHHGANPFKRYAGMFGPAGHDEDGRVIGNYHFRGEGPQGSRRLSRIRPYSTAIISDGLASREDLNHRRGTNIVRVDLAAIWYSDDNQSLRRTLDIIDDGVRFGSTPQSDPWGVVDGDGGSTGR